MLAFGILYWLVPRLYKTGALQREPGQRAHFWIGTIGIVLYTVTMWGAA